MTARRGFTLIEILIACILLGVGVTSVIGVLLVSLQRSREITAMSTMGPTATAAASLAVAFDQVPPPGAVLVLPDSPTAPAEAIRPRFAFASPYALAIDRAPGAGDDEGSPVRDAVSGGDDAQLVTLRVRVYDTPEQRDRDARRLGTMFIRQYLRTRP